MEIKGFLSLMKRALIGGSLWDLRDRSSYLHLTKDDFGYEGEKSTHTLHEHNPKYCRIAM
jgi:hypothetical protein